MRYKKTPSDNFIFALDAKLFMMTGQKEELEIVCIFFVNL